MPDTALRAITDDGSFRVIAVRTTDTVRQAIAAQHLMGDTARLFAEVLTAAALIRETMSPDLRVQAILQGDDGASRVVADANPDGTLRGLVQLAKDAKVVPVGPRAMLKVSRTLSTGGIHQGVVEVPAKTETIGAMSGALMRYMQDSELVLSVIALGCDVDAGGEVRAAGGFVVQLLPELAEGQLMVMTERMRDFERIEPLLASGAAEPEALIREILWGMPWTNVGSRELGFGCSCSQARVVASLAYLPKGDIQEMIDDARILEIACDYCGKEYHVAPEQLRGLLEAQ